MQREDVRDTTQQIFERVEARLKAVCQFTVTANGRSAKEVAKQVCNQPSLSGLQGPTVRGEHDSSVKPGTGEPHWRVWFRSWF